jgi:hypothetical protein
MFAPADLTRFSIRAQRSLNRAGTTKLERYGSDKQTDKQTSGAGCWTGARGGLAENTIEAACDWRSTQLTIGHNLCDCSVAALGTEGGEEKAVRDEHEHGRSLDEERQRV